MERSFPVPRRYCHSRQLWPWKSYTAGLSQENGRDQPPRCWIPTTPGVRSLKPWLARVTDVFDLRFSMNGAHLDPMHYTGSTR